MRIIILQKDADPNALRQKLQRLGLWTRFLHGKTESMMVVEPASNELSLETLFAIPEILDVVETASNHPLIDKQSSQFLIGDTLIGKNAAPCLMAGPCSIESETQIHYLAEQVAKAGATFLRGGAFKPRTSPYSFQGHGYKALAWLQSAAKKNNLHVVTEVLDTVDVKRVAEHADLLQIGTRNMYNYALLKQAGQTSKPILLKRGLSATIEEWLSSAEYCLMHGAKYVILCERGIRGFDPQTRNLLDLGAVALLSHIKCLPVMVDPSHALGRKDLISPMSKAALAAGACGLMLETHQDPGEALSDGPQALLPSDLIALWEEITVQRRMIG